MNEKLDQERELFSCLSVLQMEEIAAGSQAPLNRDRGKARKVPDAGQRLSVACHGRC